MGTGDKKTGKKRQGGKGRPFEKGNPGGPGRPVGSVGEYTLFKQQMLEGMKLAAKQGGLKGAVEWLAEVCGAETVRYFEALARQIPKEVKQDITRRTADDFGKELAAMPEDELKRLARAVDAE